MGKPRPQSSASSPSDDQSLVQALANILSKVVKRLDHQESVLNSIEKKMSSASTSGSSGESTKKPKVALLVRVSFVSYKILL